jgi:Zn-dependent peptidase ImmA (M78 family)
MASVKYIRDRARNILDDFDIRDPPVPVREIIEGFALTLEDVQGPDFYDGELIPEQRRIKINIMKSRTRQRFTLAHELGHWVLFHKNRIHSFEDDDEETFSNEIMDTGYDEEDPFDDEDWVPDPDMEDIVAGPVDLGPTKRERDQEANIFAAELLMPTKWVRAHWKQLGPNVEQLAHLYGVSEQAMWHKIRGLGLLKR